MKLAELRKKSKKELEALLHTNQGRVDELRFMLYQKKVKNVKEVAGVKKDIARILTVRNESAKSL